MRLSQPLIVGLTAAVLVALAGCGRTRPPSSPPRATATNQLRTFLVKGEVKGLTPGSRTVLVRHEEIPGYMPAMTMPLDVKDTNELAGLQVGDQISFRLIDAGDEAWIEGLTKLTPANPPAPQPTPHVRLVRDVEPLAEGDLMPDYRFTNELGQAVSLSGLKGRAYAFTFIFTRCPLPNFCPRMSMNFAEACKKLRAHPDAPTNWHLLTLSFDVDFDTSARLKDYARRYSYDPTHWSFLTGAIIDIDAITEQFGLMFTRDESGVNFTHTLRTVVVNTTGRVQKIFIGNEWKSDELVEEIMKAARASPKEASR
jgi:protein SCO1/2